VEVIVSPPQPCRQKRGENGVFVFHSERFERVICVSWSRVGEAKYGEVVDSLKSLCPS
jgi:hypothetical protein